MLTNESLNHRICWFQALSIIIARIRQSKGLHHDKWRLQSNITIERCKFHGASRCNPHELGRIQDESNIVERRRNETSRGDKSFLVLIPESVCERETCEKGTNAWHE